MLILPTTLTTREARDTQRMLSQALQQAVRSDAGPVVTVNASGLQQFDSAALAVLLECQRKAQAFGKGFVVKQAPDKLVSLAKLYGIDALLMPDESTAA